MSKMKFSAFSLKALYAKIVISVKDTKIRGLLTFVVLPSNSSLKISNSQNIFINKDLKQKSREIMSCNSSYHIISFKIHQNLTLGACNISSQLINTVFMVVFLAAYTKSWDSWIQTPTLLTGSNALKSCFQ